MANVDVSPSAGDAAGAPSPEAQPASFPPVEKGGGAGSPNNLDFILDIPMQVTVQVGSARMQIREILQLGQGSVIELEKLAGEPMEVLVNDKFGIRLTDVISAAQRVQQLG